MSSSDARHSAQRIQEAWRSLLSHFEQTLWPLRVETWLSASFAKDGMDQACRELAAQIQAVPAILEEWMALPAPAKKEAAAAGEPAAKLDALERVRIFGLDRSRAFWVGAVVRHQGGVSVREKLDWLSTPLPAWKALERIFAGDEGARALHLECAIVDEIFKAWLKATFEQADALRARRWLENRLEDWVKAWKGLRESARSGEGKSIESVFRCVFLFDLGRAAMIALDPRVTALWSNSSTPASVPVLLGLESLRFGANSAQFAAVVAQALGHWSPLATPLRLLSRPWRKSHDQVQSAYSLVLTQLQSQLERKAA